MLVLAPAASVLGAIALSNFLTRCGRSVWAASQEEAERELRSALSGQPGAKPGSSGGKEAAQQQAGGKGGKASKGKYVPG